MKENEVDESEIHRLQEESERLFSLPIDMLCVFGYSGYFKRVNPVLCERLGFTPEDFLRKSYLKFVHPEDALGAISVFQKIKKGADPVIFENRWRCKDGSFRWLNWTAYPVPEERLVYALARDITGQKQDKENLERMAFTDPLTGLFNRRGFVMVAERMMKIASRKKSGLLFMMADLNDMKFINDSYGHKEGDAALVNAAEILRERFRDSDLIARIGGDEFAAAFLTRTETQDVESIRKSLEEILEKKNHEAGRPYALSMSFGFAHAPIASQTTVDELLDFADQSMYEHKKEIHASGEDFGRKSA